MKSIIDMIEDFCDERGWSKSRFGREVMNDPGFVFDLEQGRECLPSTVDRVTHFIGENTWTR